MKKKKSENFPLINVKKRKKETWYQLTEYLEFDFRSLPLHEEG